MNRNVLLLAMLLFCVPTFSLHVPLIIPPNENITHEQAKKLSSFFYELYDAAWQLLIHHREEWAGKRLRDIILSMEAYGLTDDQIDDILECVLSKVRDDRPDQ